MAGSIKIGTHIHNTKWFINAVTQTRRKGLRLLVLQYLFVWSFSFFSENHPVLGVKNFMLSRRFDKVGSNQCLESISLQKLTKLSAHAARNYVVITNPLQRAGLSSKVLQQRFNECLGLDPFVSLNIAPYSVNSVQEIAISKGLDQNDFRGLFLNLRVDELAGACGAWELGQLAASRIVCLHRHKLWWMKPFHALHTRQVPAETQLLLMELPRTQEEGENSKQRYCLMVPLIDSNAKFTLRGLSNNRLQLRAETGDLKESIAYGSLCGLFVGVDTDPFNLLQTAFSQIAQRLQGQVRSGVGAWNPTAATSFPLTAQSTEQTKESCQPTFLDSFGWCTWDSFYTQVNPEGVKKGLSSLRESGFTPKWMVLDDGWQSTSNPDAKNEQQWFDKLTSLKANYKFRDETLGIDLGDLVKDVKKEFGITHFMVWHALAGYWAGVEKNTEMLKYRIIENLPYSPATLMKVDWDLWKFVKYCYLTNKRSGMVHPDNIQKFFSDYHNYLVEQGVDGIKVDAQSAVNVMGIGLGGSVRVALAYHMGLWRSAMERFIGSSKESETDKSTVSIPFTSAENKNGTPNLIHCMCHDSEILLLLGAIYKNRPIIRGSDDHYPRDHASHGPHLYFNAFNSLLISYVGVQDWDMFQTTLGPSSWLHGAARALSGGPVYISDRPGQHCAELLRKLVLKDGSILRSKHNALPTLKNMFEDSQTRNSLLSIWNTNYVKDSGVVGVFNIHGSSWNHIKRRFWFHPGYMGKYASVVGSVSASDVHSIKHNGNTKYAIYLHNKMNLYKRDYKDQIEVEIPHMNFEIASVAPISCFGENTPVEWAAIGLVEQFNSGAAILDQTIVYSPNKTAFVATKIHGGGKFMFLCSQKPSRSLLITCNDLTVNNVLENWEEMSLGGQMISSTFSSNDEGTGFLELDVPFQTITNSHQVILNIWEC